MVRVFKFAIFFVNEKINAQKFDRTRNAVTIKFLLKNQMLLKCICI